jgi:hypothetical protein
MLLVECANNESCSAPAAAAAVTAMGCLWLGSFCGHLAGRPCVGKATNKRPRTPEGACRRRLSVQWPLWHSVSSVRAASAAHQVSPAGPLAARPGQW